MLIITDKVMIKIINLNFKFKHFRKILFDLIEKCNVYGESKSVVEAKFVA